MPECGGLHSRIDLRTHTRSLGLCHTFYSVFFRDQPLFLPRANFALWLRGGQKELAVIALSIFMWNFNSPSVVAPFLYSSLSATSTWNLAFCQKFAKNLVNSSCLLMNVLYGPFPPPQLPPNPTTLELLILTSVYFYFCRMSEGHTSSIYHPESKARKALT